MKTTVAAIDFGTSKIVTLVAENSGSQRCDIVGAGIAAYDGYLEEGWNNPVCYSFLPQKAESCSASSSGPYK